MKALLVTRCGCTKLVDVPEDKAGKELFVPLQPRVDYSVTDRLPSPHEPREERIRYFNVTGRTHIYGLGTVFTYLES